jgi:hypothetical protein
LSFREFLFAFLAGGGLEHEEAEEELLLLNCVRETPCWSNSIVSASRAASRLRESRSSELSAAEPVPGKLDMAPDGADDEHMGDVSVDVSEQLCALLRDEEFFTP